MPSVLITGAAGFIGSRLAEAMQNRWTVQGADRVSLQSELSLDALRSSAPDLCIHCAGTSSVSRSVAEPLQDFHDNVLSTATVLEALRIGAPRCRFLLISSGAVYGNPSRLPVDESAEISPLSPYGYHKAAAELLCREYATVHGLQTAVARIFSCYGPGLKRQVLWDICTKSALPGDLELAGTGEETRDFLHVEDVVAALLCIERGAAWSGEAYNVGSGRETSIATLSSMLLSSLGTSKKIRWGGVVPKGVPVRTHADISRLRTLGFAPSISLSDGLLEYVSWFPQQKL